MSIESLRADFKLVSEWWAQCCGWSQAEIHEAAVTVRDAIESNDAERIDGWAAWLAELAVPLRRTGERLRAYERRVRDEAEQARRKVA